MPQTLRPTDDLIVQTRRELHDLGVAYDRLQDENARLIRENGHLAVENSVLRGLMDRVMELAEYDRNLRDIAADYAETNK